MTTPATTRSGVGLRHVQIFALNSSGYPNATSTTAYEGVQLSGAVSLTLDDPEPQQIEHRGDDRVFALDQLPPTAAVSGSLTVAKINDTVDAILTDDNSFTIGEAKFFGMGTDNRGDENQVGLLAFRQTLDTDPTSSTYGARRWELRILPKAFLIPGAAGLEQDATESKAYSVYPQFVKYHLWGEAFSTGTEGFEQAQVLRGISEYKPKIVAWQATDNGQETLSLPAAYPAQATAKIKVWVNGTVTVPDTLATTQISFTTGVLTTSAIVVAFYEYA